MRKNIKEVILVCISLALAFCPFYNMILNGVYRWHVMQPEFIQGGLELLMVGAFILIGWHFMNDKIIIPLLLGGSIYLIHNGVILPVLTVLTYFFIIWYIGAIYSKLKQDEINNSFLSSLIWGIGIWGIGAVLLSIVGLGTINELRFYTMILFISAIGIGKNKKHYYLMDKIKKYFSFKTNNFVDVLFITVLFLIICALCAKTNTAQDYDSLWYGLRPEYVLVGKSSFFDNLGYCSVVYYYPKLMELLYLPISSLGDYSFLQCANIGVFVILLYIMNNYIKNFVPNMSFRQRLMLLTIIGSIPAIANISATAKPDIMGMLFVFAAFYYCKSYLKQKNYDSLVKGFLCLVLCTGTKQTYILWGGLLFLWFSVLLIIDRKRFNKNNFIFSLKKNALLVVSIIGLIGGIHYRTLKLTGYPIYAVGLNVWNKLGFQAHDFLLSNNVVSLLGNKVTLGDIMKRLYGFIINPTTLPHVIMLWTSNVLLISLVTLLLYHKKKLNKSDIALAIIYLIFFIYFAATMLNPDGNYFIAPIVIVLLICIENCNIVTEKNKGINITVALLLITMLPIMFVSHPSWAWGTKPFSSEIIASNFDTTDTNIQIMEYYGLAAICEEVSMYSLEDRVIASGGSSGVCFRLPCAVETFAELEQPVLSNYENVSNYENFKYYLDTLNVKALIVLKDDTTVFPEYASNYVNEKGVVNVIEDGGAICYVMR